MQPILYYCYDAYCGWCFGNRDTMAQVYKTYNTTLSVEVLSGGMVINATPKPISLTADYIKNAYGNVQTATGCTFGADYLWHINNPHKSDWYPSSEKPAIAMSVFKDIYPTMQLQFANDLLYALHYDGRDLCDDESYRHLLVKYNIDATTFYQKIKEKTYKDAAYAEFKVCQQLGVKGFPTLYLQLPNNAIHAITNGYTSFTIIKERIDLLLTP